MFSWFMRPQASSNNPDSNSNSSSSFNPSLRSNRTLNAQEQSPRHQPYRSNHSNSNAYANSRTAIRYPYNLSSAVVNEPEGERDERARRATSPYSESEEVSEEDEAPRRARTALPNSTHDGNTMVNGRSNIPPRVYNTSHSRARTVVPNPTPTPTSPPRIPGYNTIHSPIARSNQTRLSSNSTPAPAYSRDIEPGYPLSRPPAMYTNTARAYKTQGQILGSNSSQRNGPLHGDGREAIRIAAAEAADARRIQNITHGMPRIRARENRRRERNRVSKISGKRLW